MLRPLGLVGLLYTKKKDFRYVPFEHLLPVDVLLHLLLDAGIRLGRRIAGLPSVLDLFDEYPADLVVRRVLRLLILALVEEGGQVALKKKGKMLVDHPGVGPKIRESLRLLDLPGEVVEANRDFVELLNRRGSRLLHVGLNVGCGHILSQPPDAFPEHRLVNSPEHLCLVVKAIRRNRTPLCGFLYHLLAADKR